MTELEKAAREQEMKVCPYEFRCSVSDECYLCQWGGASKQIRFAANESFVLGAEWQSKQSPWISVVERLPESDDNVFYKNYLSNAVGVANYYSDTKEWNQSYTAELIFGITHWMEITE